LSSGLVHVCVRYKLVKWNWVATLLIATAWRYCDVFEVILSEGLSWGSKNLWTVYGQCNNHWKLPEEPLIQNTKFHTRVSWLSSHTVPSPGLLFIHPPVISFPPPSSSFAIIQVDVIRNMSPYEQNEQPCFVLPCFDVVSQVSASAAECLMVWRRLHVRATCWTACSQRKRAHAHTHSVHTGVFCVLTLPFFKMDTGLTSIGQVGGTYPLKRSSVETAGKPLSLEKSC